MKDALLEKGIELFSEYGYHGTGLKTVLDAVKVPKGSFYNYFESKEQFAAAIIETYSRQMISRLDAYLDTTDEDPVTAIRSVYRTMIRELAEQGFQKGCLLGNLAGEIGGMSQVCQAAMGKAFDAWQGRFVRLIRAAQDQDLIRKDIPAEDLTEIFWNHWEGAVLRMKIEGDAGHAAASMDILLDILFK